MKIQSHRDLIVWQKSMDLAVAVYKASEAFPKHELYRLSSQLTGAISSVPGNIAEGNARSTRKDYAHFLSIAKGSLMESETFVGLALRLGYLSQEEADPLFSAITEVSKMLTVLRSKLIS
jgi:four helix bundle protein